MRRYRSILALMTFAVITATLTVTAAETERDAAAVKRKATKTATVPTATTGSASTANATHATTGTGTSPTSPTAGEEINWSVIGAGGETGTSTNWIVSGTVGQSSVGSATSTNYVGLHGFWQDFGLSGPDCCVDRVGNANGVMGEKPTIGDVAAMIDANFISLTCDNKIPCLAEADINQSGGVNPTCDDITIGDISLLIDYLFITGPSLVLPECL
jgi:hypothetical protein